MKIKDLALFNFRSFEFSQVEFSEGINLITGTNGQGKTSILEAIALFALGKSVRSRQDRDMIRFGCEVAQLRTAVETNQTVNHLAIKITTQGKQIAVNQIRKKTLTDMIGKLRMVIFTPDDLDLIKGGPDERRKFINQYLVQISSDYLQNLREYNQLLNQRNHLLKQKLASAISIWDDSLCKSGARIIMARKIFLDRLSFLARERYQQIANGLEQLDVNYKPSCGGNNLSELTELLAFYLKQQLQKDLEKGYTSVGPHRDDIEFKIDERPAARYASQGQIRSAVLAVKFSILDYFYEIIGDYPVMLLDDVMSELDEMRKGALMELMKKTQTIMTTSDLHGLHELYGPASRLFEVAHGIIISKR